MPVFVSRVPTVYSLKQLEDDAAPQGILHSPEESVGMVAGKFLPTFSFAATKSSNRIRSFGDLQSAAIVPDVDDAGSWGSGSSDDDGRVPTAPFGDSFDDSFQDSGMLNSVLLAEWEDRAEQGLMRYDVTACPTKTVPGPYGFIAQYNEGRASKKRPTEFRVDKVIQPFDKVKFNFTKALQKEVLFQLCAVPGARGELFQASAPVGASPDLVVINVSPIEYGHVLLVPKVLDNLNQLVDTQTMALALQFAQAANNPYFRLGFNSLGAYATINHLHFQGYYLASPFAVERAPTVPLAGYGERHKGVAVAQLSEYPVRGLVFEASSSLENVAAVVGNACMRLANANVPHNLFVADCGNRVFLFPNAFSANKASGAVPEDILDSTVDPATFEISGHILVKRAEDYEACTQDWVWRLLSYASYPEDKFHEIVKLALCDW